MSKTKMIKRTEIIMKLAFTAVLADLFYIIARVREPIVTIEDASFAYAMPEMLRYMLLSAVIITAFSAAMAYIIREEGDT